MKTFLLALVLLFQDVELKPRLVAGDSFQLEVIRLRENSQRPQSNGRSRTRVDVQVVSAGTEGSVVDWIPGPTDFLDNPAAMNDPMVAAAARAVEALRFRIRLNADGEFDGLVNEAQVTQQLQAMTGTITKPLLESLPPEQRPQAEALFAQIFTPALLISTATRDAQIYFGMNGATLTAGETLEVPLEQPSPIGGGTLAATYRIRTGSATDTSATLSTTMIYDPEGLRGLTAALLKQAGVTAPPSELAAMTVQMRDEGEYSYDRTLGLMREAVITRRLSAGPMYRLDGWTIRLVSEPKR